MDRSRDGFEFAGTVRLDVRKIDAGNVGEPSWRINCKPRRFEFLSHLCIYYIQLYMMSNNFYLVDFIDEYSLL